MNRDQVRKSARIASQVKRYHTWPTLQEQTVADHSFNVLRIYIQVFGPPPMEVTNYIIIHDLGEIVTGDLPYPIKKQNQSLKILVDDLESQAIEEMGFKWDHLTNFQRKSIKICDLLEMVEFAIHEETIGNKFAIPIIEDVSLHLIDLIHEIDSSTIEEMCLEYHRCMLAKRIV